MTDIAPRTMHWLPVERLRLDPRNPRLPERLHGAAQSEILRFLWEREVLDELVRSYLDNGFFQNEPLIVLPEEGGYTVVEGNRRLAALMIFLKLPPAAGIEMLGLEAGDEQRRALADVPCFEVSDRQEVHAYIGFRHIGGIKTWEPEAKARYILTEIRSLVARGVPDPFRELGRRVGSNAQGMRNPYVAIRVLLHARDELGLDVRHVQESRFGVWQRCMHSADIRRYIGLREVGSYEDIEAALEQISAEHLGEVLEDLAPRRGHGQPVLRDSRQVTVYGRALTDPRAREVLRQTRDLDLARQVIEDLDLDARVRRLADSVKLVIDALHRAQVSQELYDALEELAGLSRSARDIVRGRLAERDDEGA